ncbi:MAG: hypothetical protein ACPGVO_08350 [Spirulinaceae cyanobacterium]
MARLSKDFDTNNRVSANQIQLSQDMFALSSGDKKSTPPHLSVWAEIFTTPKQAHGFLKIAQGKDRRRLILRLGVDKIRALVGNNSIRDYAELLDVIWVYLEGEQSKFSGADGHSGITGLESKREGAFAQVENKKYLLKSLRSQLADIASVTGVVE